MKLHNYMKSNVLNIFVGVTLSLFVFNVFCIEPKSYHSNKNELFIRFKKPSEITLETITQKMSIVKRYSTDSIVACMNQNEFSNFLELKIPYVALNAHPQIITKQAISQNIWEWNSYPNYDQYLAMLDSLVNAYPKLCSIVEIGESTLGLKILAIRITSHIIPDSGKIKVFYTSTMHGNETTGFILMLRLSHLLLSQYQKDIQISRLVDSLDIYINPVSNPDGLFFENQSVSFNSTRGNSNGIDLNRNFPDPVWGSHANGHKKYEQETQVMMAFMEKHRFDLSANFHDGAELVNFPWDTQTFDQTSKFFYNHPDRSWYNLVCKRYADTAMFYGPSGYFKGTFPNGYTQGRDWYPVYGGRQDYCVYFLGGREVTVELQDMSPYPYKTPETRLNELWVANYPSLLNYMSEAIELYPTEKINVVSPVALKRVFIVVDNRLIFNEGIVVLGPVEIKIFNISGQLMYQNSFDYNVYRSIFLPEILKGLYLIKIKTNQGTFVDKAIFGNR